MTETSTAKRIVAVGPRQLEGILRQPQSSSGLVIFAHGAGSSRLSPRNNYFADRLADRRIATLLFDLLTEEEAADRANFFDIPLLIARCSQGNAGKDQRSSSNYSSSRRSSS